MLVSSAAMADDNCHNAHADGQNVADLIRCISAARTGNAEAQYGYGLILWSGNDHRRDHEAALHWMRLSARKRYRPAQRSLAEFLLYPKLEKRLRKPLEAYAWSVTAGQGDVAANILATLSSVDALAAQQMAAEYVAKYARKGEIAAP
jgi:TPR repeat protein